VSVKNQDRCPGRGPGPREAADPAGIDFEPREGGRELESVLLARRRGHYVVGPVGIRARAGSGSAAWYHRSGQRAEVDVYPDLHSARRLALAAREGRLVDASRRAHGPLGMGTEFESRAS